MNELRPWKRWDLYGILTNDDGSIRTIDW